MVESFPNVRAHTVFNLTVNLYLIIFLVLIDSHYRMCYNESNTSNVDRVRKELIKLCGNFLAAFPE